MSTEIKIWQVENEKLVPIESNMVEEGRKEVKDLEKWIESNPSILGTDILIIGKQVQTKSNIRLDFLAIDKSGNVVIIELKRDSGQREMLAQAIDYASDISDWEIERLNEECMKYRNVELSEAISENWEDVELENISLNQIRILLVCVEIQESLQRMIEWLSENYDLNINAIVLKYVKIKSGDELLARTMIIPEEKEKEISQKRQKRIVETSNEPGNYDDEELKEKLKIYLTSGETTANRIRDIVLPMCLNQKIVKRQDLIKEIEKGNTTDKSPGIIMSTISNLLGQKKKDFLRQVIRWDTGPAGPWEKENYRIEERYKNLVKDILSEISQ